MFQYYGQNNVIYLSSHYYKTSANNTLNKYTLYYFWQSFYIFWPVTSGVEAGYVWNVGDQGVL